MSSCRGIVVAGVTNRARTQMAEAILRRLTGGRVYITSGGVRFTGPVHPLAISTVQDAMGWDMSGHTASTLANTRRRLGTFDVFISIDGSYAGKQASSTALRRGNAEGGAAWRGDAAGSLLRQDGTESSWHSSDALRKEGNEEDVSAQQQSVYDVVEPRTPSHWGVGADATDARQLWHLWSPRDPTIFHETSTRKFQDDLYAGEPLFSSFKTDTSRRLMKISERWEIEDITTRNAMEREEEQRQRFIAAFHIISGKCVALVNRLDAQSDLSVTDADELNRLTEYLRAHPVPSSPHVSA